MTLQSRGHLTNEERFISTSTTPMATKRDREVDPDEEMLSQVGRQKIKSRMYFVPGSCDTKKTLYLNFCEAIPTKLGMVIAYEKGTPSTMVT